MNSYQSIFPFLPVGCPAFTVEGSIQGSWAASPTGTTATIECAVTHSLVGTSTLTCQDDGSWSTDIPHCDKSKFIIHTSISLKFKCFLFYSNL